MSDTNFKFNTSKTECLILPAKSFSSFRLQNLHPFCYSDSMLGHFLFTPIIIKMQYATKVSLSTSKILLSPSLCLYFNTTEMSSTPTAASAISSLNKHPNPFYSILIDFLFKSDLKKNIS